MPYLLSMVITLIGILIAFVYEGKYRNELRRNVSLWEELLGEHEQRKAAQVAYRRLLGLMVKKVKSGE